MGRSRGHQEGYLRWRRDLIHNTRRGRFRQEPGRVRPPFRGNRADFRNGSISTELGCPRRVRFTPVSDRTADIAGGSVRATFGLMHCGITSSACAGNAAHRLSRRGGAGGVPRRPRRGACAHHRVERTDRDARHEARSTRSRATSSTKPPPTAAPREPARRQSAGRRRRPCTEAIAAVLRRGSLCVSKI